MARIIKGVQSKYFEEMLSGEKRYELRLANFAYQPGDTLVLQEEHDGTKELTGREIETEILNTINTKEAEQWWSKEDIDKYGMVVLSIRKNYRRSED